MTLVDIFIVYLAFGSPVMVHRYLASRRLERDKRIVFAVAGLAFWVPLVAQMGYRYLINAYSKHGFVSWRDSDATGPLVNEFRSLMRDELSDSAVAITLRRELLEAVARYVALSTALHTWSDDGEKAFNLFSVAETNREIGSVCLIRRNHKLLTDHHIRAREDLLLLLQVAAEGLTTDVQTETTSLLIRIAEQFGDETLVAELFTGGSDGKDRSWSTHHQPAQQKV